MEKKRIAAVVLAAGFSERMGQPKALLKLGPSVFLETIYQLLDESGFDPLLTVLGDDFQEIYKSIKKKRNILFLRNEHPDKGQLSSFQLALRHVPWDSPGCLMVLVDHPMVTLPTYLYLNESAKNSPDKIIVPVYQGKRGHPVYWTRDLFDELLQTDHAKGARQVAINNQHLIVELEVDDEGVLIDIDTPEEYQAYLSRHSNAS